MCDIHMFLLSKRHCFGQRNTKDCRQGTYLKKERIRKVKVTVLPRLSVN